MALRNWNICARNHVISAREKIGLLRWGEAEEAEGLEDRDEEFGEGLELEELDAFEALEVEEEEGSKSGSINLLK